MTTIDKKGAFHDSQGRYADKPGSGLGGFQLERPTLPQRGLGGIPATEVHRWNILFELLGEDKAGSMESSDLGGMRSYYLLKCETQDEQDRAIESAIAAGLGWKEEDQKIREEHSLGVQFLKTYGPNEEQNLAYQKTVEIAEELGLERDGYNRIVDENGVIYRVTNDKGRGIIHVSDHKTNSNLVWGDKTPKEMTFALDKNSGTVAKEMQRKLIEPMKGQLELGNAEQQKKDALKQQRKNVVATLEALGGYNDEPQKGWYDDRSKVRLKDAYWRVSDGGKVDITFDSPLNLDRLEPVPPETTKRTFEWMAELVANSTRENRPPEFSTDTSGSMSIQGVRPWDALDLAKRLCE